MSQLWKLLGLSTSGQYVFEECRDRVMVYDTMLLFSPKYNLEDSFNVERIIRAVSEFKDTVEWYDFNISELAAQASIRYHNSPDTVIFFGGVLFRKGVLQ